MRTGLASPLPYHPPMRTLLIVLMMALAPLRMWAGEVMALTMLVQQPVAAHHGLAAVPPARADQGGMPMSHADCTGHGSGLAAPVTSGEIEAADADAAGTQAASDGPTCSLCQACSVPALAFQTTWARVVGFTHAVPAFGGRPHASAAASPGFKPPIS